MSAILILLIWLTTVSSFIVQQTAKRNVTHTDTDMNSTNKVIDLLKKQYYTNVVTSRPEDLYIPRPENAYIQPRSSKTQLKLKLRVPKNCTNMSVCSEKPVLLGPESYDELIEKLYNKKVLMHVLGPPPLGTDSNEYTSNEVYKNDILMDTPKYATPYLLKGDKGAMYMIPQSLHHNQTVREVNCMEAQQSHATCNKLANNNKGYEKIIVQKYSVIRMDAVELTKSLENTYDGHIVKLNYHFKNGCVCKYKKVQ